MVLGSEGNDGDSFVDCCIDDRLSGLQVFKGDWELHTRFEVLGFNPIHIISSQNLSDPSIF
ncbi:hypothetical protein Hanom_Chr06g00551311 [Helianthus anomalus]